MDSIKELLATIAPWIGTALGGPLGGAAAKAVVSALGLPASSEASQKELTSAILGATPEQLLALKNADQAFQVHMTELGFQNLKDLESIAAADRASARSREVSTGDKTPRVLAFAIVLGWLAVQAVLLYHTISPEAKDIILRMLGTLDAALMAVLYYYFGSSSGSHEKDATIKAMNEKES